jgi:hypothetical protein
MLRTLRIVVGSAAVGFVLPLLLLAYYAAANYAGNYPNTNLLFYLCPTSILCMALDNASTATAIFVWLLISTSNAVLYALPGVVVALILRFRDSNSDTTGLGL